MKAPKFLFVISAAVCLALQSAGAWQAAEGPLKTRWTAEVKPDSVHKEYPRPSMVRGDWISLNGLWNLNISSKETVQPGEFPYQVLVPFPVESALSGVMKRVTENDRLWYRCLFTVPLKWIGQRTLLHFGAVDFEAVVWVNGKQMGKHRGGYDAFSFDVTDALNPGGENELIVGVWDPTDAGTQPRGKQVRNPNGIWYTPTSGIWQTVWLEKVPAAHIESLKTTPDIDSESVVVLPETARLLGEYQLQAIVKDGWRKIGEASAAPGREIRIPIRKAKLWSPEDPHLYTLTVKLTLGNRTVDQVESYFGMRKISIGKDENGFTRLLLNNKPYFQLGLLDQGFWPDGLYTAPTDEALRYDIETTRKLGFNLARKHVKVEPERWYYWADKLGLLVWQDMPSGDKYIGGNAPDITRSSESAQEFEKELAEVVRERSVHPCIVMWVPYNEGWGQWDTARIAKMIKDLDPSRLVDSASGWADRNVGDVRDIHAYPGPAAPGPEPGRASVLGEFGGLGLPIRGHTWQSEKNWGYRSFTDAASLTQAYVDLLKKLFPLTVEKGLSAAVYTQTTDVEVEVNGIMTYDRAMVKMDAGQITRANHGNFLPAAEAGPAGKKTKK